MGHLCNMEGEVLNRFYMEVVRAPDSTGVGMIHYVDTREGISEKICYRVSEDGGKLMGWLQRGNESQSQQFPIEPKFGNNGLISLTFNHHIRVVCVVVQHDFYYPLEEIEASERE